MTGQAETLLDELPPLLDRQQQVKAAGQTVAAYLAGGGDPRRLLALRSRLLLCEDRDFHAIQAVEAAFRQYGLRQASPAPTIS